MRTTVALEKIGIPLDSPPVSAWLPLRISFYTFQVIGYLIDIRRGEVKAERNFLIFGNFVSNTALELSILMKPSNCPLGPHPILSLNMSYFPFVIRDV